MSDLGRGHALDAIQQITDAGQHSDQGLGLDRFCCKPRRLLLDQRLVVNATGPTTIRLLPPLTVTEPEIDSALERIGAALT